MKFWIKTMKMNMKLISYRNCYVIDKEILEEKVIVVINIAVDYIKASMMEILAKLPIDVSRFSLNSTLQETSY